MCQMSLLDEDPQHRTYGRVGGRVGHSLSDPGGGGVAQLVDDVHDFALSSAEPWQLGQCGLTFSGGGGEQLIPAPAGLTIICCWC